MRPPAEGGRAPQNTGRPPGHQLPTAGSYSEDGISVLQGRWHPAQGPIRRQWVKKVGCRRDGFYSAENKNEVVSSAGKWTELEDITLMKPETQGSALVLTSRS